LCQKWKKKTKERTIDEEGCFARNGKKTKERTIVENLFCFLEVVCSIVCLLQGCDRS
jgi:hypothetical protein